MASSLNPQRPEIQAIQTGEMTDRDLERFAKLAHASSGVVLNTAKRQMVRSRLIRRLRARGLDSFASYADLLERGDPAEEQEFLNSITTHHTGFYREPHHFETLETHLATWSKRNLQQDPIKIWSSAASTGQEPYTIGMSILRVDPAARRQTYKILGTDIDTAVIDYASNGRYPAADLERSTNDYWRPYFDAVGDAEFCVQQRLRSLISFNQLNLLKSWPITGTFDVVFCRNVIIYFDNPTKERLLARIREVLRPGGLLFLGHSETLGARDGLKPIGRTTFLKDS